MPTRERSSRSSPAGLAPANSEIQNPAAEAPSQLSGRLSRPRGGNGGRRHACLRRPVHVAIVGSTTPSPSSHPVAWTARGGVASPQRRTRPARDPLPPVSPGFEHARPGMQVFRGIGETVRVRDAPDLNAPNSPATAVRGWHRLGVAFWPVRLGVRRDLSRAPRPMGPTARCSPTDSGPAARGRG